jgi:hypothetical protein
MSIGYYIVVIQQITYTGMSKALNLEISMISHHKVSSRVEMKVSVIPLVNSIML